MISAQESAEGRRSLALPRRGGVEPAGAAGNEPSSPGGTEDDAHRAAASSSERGPAECSGEAGAARAAGRGTPDTRHPSDGEPCESAALAGSERDGAGTRTRTDVKDVSALCVVCQGWWTSGPKQMCGRCMADSRKGLYLGGLLLRERERRERRRLTGEETASTRDSQPTAAGSAPVAAPRTREVIGTDRRMLVDTEKHATAGEATSAPPAALQTSSAKRKPKSQGTQRTKRCRTTCPQEVFPAIFARSNKLAQRFPSLACTG